VVVCFLGHKADRGD